MTFEDEVLHTSDGTALLTQHVAVLSPGRLKPGEWYFVAGTIEKSKTPETPQPANMSSMTLYANAEPVGQVKTTEVVDYRIDKMYMTIGVVDKGTWQNFDGLIDEVRIYDRPLSTDEIKALYHQPWTKPR